MRLVDNEFIILQSGKIAVNELSIPHRETIIGNGFIHSAESVYLGVDNAEMKINIITRRGFTPPRY